MPELRQPLGLKRIFGFFGLTGQNSSGDDAYLRVNSNNQLQVEVVQSASTNKILGTSAPSATTNTNLYTVPASTETRVRKMWAANRGSSQITIRIGVDVGGSGTNSPSTAEWMFYDAPLESGQTLEFGDFWLAATDDLVVYASTGDAAFVASGEEHT